MPIGVGTPRRLTRQLAARLREARALCDEHGEVASASLLETWIDESEGRSWFLLEASRDD